MTPTTKKRATKSLKPAEHPVLFVHVRNSKVTIECGCGWTSEPAKSESDARALHEQHLEGG